MYGRGRGRGRGGGASFASQQSHKTTQLSAALRQELGIEIPQPSQHGHRHSSSGRGRGRGAPVARGGVIGRKDARRDARAVKKQGGTAPNAARPYASQGSGSSSAQTGVKRKRASEETEHPAKPTISPAKKVKSAEHGQTTSKGSAVSTVKSKPKSGSKSTSHVEEPSSRTTQKKHVAADAQTPLERMLAAQDGRAGSSSSAPASDAASGPGPVRRKKRSKMTQTEKDEEDEIAWLEAKLGASGKGADGDDAEGEDGLGVLIRELDRYQTGMFEQGSKDDEDEDEETDSDDDDDEDSDDSDDRVDDESSRDNDNYIDSDLGEEDGSDLLSEVDDTDDDSDGEVEHPVQQPISKATPTPADSGKYIPPALRRAAAEAQAPSGQASTGSAALAASAPVADPKLVRTLNGLLNRLSSANLDAIMGDIIAAYGSYPRAIVTQSLVRLVLETVALQPNLVDSIVILYAALFCALGRSVGVEFGAEAVQIMVGRLVYAHAQLRSRQMLGEEVDAGQDDKAGRECLNLAVLLGHTYNLHLIAAPLIYDVVRLCLRDGAAVRAGRDLEAVHLQSSGQGSSDTTMSGDSDGMREIDVEVLLKLVKVCGNQMRSDDPTALRDIVSLTQEHISSESESATTLGSRARFMLETLTDLQKSRSKSSKAGAAAFGADGTVANEALARYKKYITSLAKRPDRLLRSSAASGVSSVDEPLLNIGLRDLADSTRKGRWWLVGAAWTGHDGSKDGDEVGDVDASDAAPEGVTAKRKLVKKGAVAAESVAKTTEDESLVILAREHGMNTDARRSVFITLMSSEDYVDASQRLLGLGLNEVQRREVVRVLLHCLGSEPVFNPYYVLIGQQLASESPAAGASVLTTSSTSNVISTRVTMQYCLWDHFREVGESDVGGASMLASGKRGDDADEDEFRGFDDVFGESAGYEAGGSGAVNKKMIHLARAYGWWIAKGALNLNILRTVNFAGLKQRGRSFVQLLLIYMLLSIQTASPMKTLSLSWKADRAASRYRSPIENTLVRGTAGNLELARGLLIFVKRHLRTADLAQAMGGADAGVTKGTQQALQWAVKVIEEVLEVGIQVAGQV